MICHQTNHCLIVLAGNVLEKSEGDDQPAVKQARLDSSSTSSVQTSLIHHTNTTAVSQPGQTTAALAQNLLASTLIKPSNKPLIDLTKTDTRPKQQVILNPATPSQKPSPLKVMNVTPQTVLNTSVAGQTLLKAGSQTVLLGTSAKTGAIRAISPSSGIQILTKPSAAVVKHTAHVSVTSSQNIVATAATSVHEGLSAPVTESKPTIPTVVSAVISSSPTVTATTHSKDSHCVITSSCASCTHYIKELDHMSLSL